MALSTKANVLVIGAGIAGLATAVALRRKGVERVRVLEAEPFPFSHASGRNAAIYRPLETDELLCELAARTRVLLEELQNYARAPLLVERGLLLLDRHEERLGKTQVAARKAGIPTSWVEGRHDLAKRSGMALQHDGPALWTPNGGVLDPHEIGQALLREAQARGAELRFATPVRNLSTNGRGHVDGARLESGEHVPADAVIVASGASSPRFALDLCAPTPLLPLQRHLAIVENAAGAVNDDAPVIWSLDPEFYFRPEAGGILVSPCDETPAPSGLPQADLGALSPLSDKLSRLVPALSGARVKHHWACIRTKAVDGRPLLGPDPHVGGLYFATGLGGFGMSCGLALAELFAQSFCGVRPLDLRTSPLRFRLPWHRDGRAAE